MSDTIESTNDQTATEQDATEATEATEPQAGADEGQNDDTAGTDSAQSEVETTERGYSKGYVERLRRENARYRTENKEALEKASEEAATRAREELAQSIASTLGLADDGEPVDPEELVRQAELRATESEERASGALKALRDYEIKDAVVTAAQSKSGDAALLIPYLKGKGALKGLDPEADDFADRVSAIVEAEIEANPKFKVDTATVVPSRSGGDFSGGTGAGSALADDSIDALRDKRRARRQKRHGLL